ncbi:MAG: SpoIIE family protein phosphatase [Acidobacteriaceae bacterium]
MPRPKKPKSSRTLYVLLALYIAASMTYYVANMAGFVDNYFDLHHRTETPFHFNIDSLKIDQLRPEAAQAGLAVGDILVSIDRKPYSGEAEWLTLIRNRMHPGDELRVIVRQPNGAVKSTHLTLMGRSKTSHARLSEYGSLLLLFGIPPLVCLLIGYWVVIARPRDPNAWLILIMMSFLETFFVISPNWWPGHWDFYLSALGQVEQVVAPLALLLFAVYFPERWRLDRKLPWLKWLLVAPALSSAVVLVWIAAYEDFSPAGVQATLSLNRMTNQLVYGIDIACILLYWIAIFDKSRSASTADARRRLHVLGAGSVIGLGSLLVFFGLFPLLHIDLQQRWVGNTAAIIFLAFPFTLAYVIVVQRAMDVRILLRLGTKYALARATLAVVRTGLLVGLIVLLIAALRSPSLTPRSAIEIAVLAGLLLLLRSRFTKNLSSWLDRKFFREAYNAEQLLAELSQRVRKSTESGPMLKMILKSLGETLHIDKIAVLLRGEKTFQLQQAVGIDIDGFPGGGSVQLPMNSTTVRNLMRINTPVQLYREDPDGWLLLASSSERNLLDTMSAELLLPLPGRDQLMGLMTLGPKRSEEPYTPSDLRLLESVATQTGLALEIGSLARSLANEATQRERIHREIEVAREVQERLFPQEFPAIDGVSLAGHCRPQQGVGGDYYDSFLLDDGRMCLAIGDVSGKGISAALLMASLRASLRGMTLDAPRDLAAMMEKVNRLVYEASASNRYATFFFATYNMETRELIYVNAGHNAPFLIRRHDDNFHVKRLEAGGPVVGLLPFASYEEQRCVLEPGDLLLAYTDGISEAMAENEEEWGEERMLAAAETLPDGTAQQVLEHLFAEADRFTGNAAQFDDMTLLVLKLQENPATAEFQPASISG